MMPPLAVHYERDEGQHIALRLAVIHYTEMPALSGSASAQAGRERPTSQQRAKFQNSFSRRRVFSAYYAVSYSGRDTATMPASRR